jgi:hypothetical protein
MSAIEPQRLSDSVRSGLEDAITYFRNHHHQMHYAEAIAWNLPIGSGVTESACKAIAQSTFVWRRYEMERTWCWNCLIVTQASVGL